MNEHLAAENAHDLDRIMATYVETPVIELNGHVIEGRALVREFHQGFGFAGSGVGSFSKLRVDERHRHDAGPVIVIEQTLSAVHTGTWQGIEPTGRAVAVHVCTVYVFGADGRLARERVYFDQGWLRRQLTR